MSLSVFYVRAGRIIQGHHGQEKQSVETASSRTASNQGETGESGSPRRPRRSGHIGKRRTMSQSCHWDRGIESLKGRPQGQV